MGTCNALAERMRHLRDLISRFRFDLLDGCEKVRMRHTAAEIGPAHSFKTALVISSRSLLESVLPVACTKLSASNSACCLMPSCLKRLKSRICFDSSPAN